MARREFGESMARDTRQAQLGARVLFLLLAFWPTITFAGDPLIVRRFGLEHGMPVSSATSAQIDDEGFLWFATHDGLARFDGRRFSVYDTERFADMGSNRVVRLYKGQRGSVYGVGALGAFLDIDSRRIARLRLDAQHPEAMLSFVARMQSPKSSDAEHGALCVTLTTGLYCESADASAATTGFYRRRSFAADFPAIAALPFAEDDWLIVRGQGIFYARPGGQALIFADTTIGVAERLLHAKVGRDGALVVAVPDGVLRVHADGRSEWIEVNSELDVVQLHADSNGDVRIYTSHESYRIDSTGQRSQIHAREVLEAVVRSWPVPTPATGQASLHPPADWFSRGGALYRDGELVLRARGDVEDVLFADSGIVWVSTSRDGIYALSPTRVNPIADPALAQSNVYGTAIAADGSVWAGSLGGGVFRIGVDDQVQSFGEQHGLPGANIWGVTVAADHSVLAMPLGGGVWRLRPGTERFERIPLPSSLDRARLRSMSFDRAGRLWLAGSEGAWCQTDASAGAAGWRKQWPTVDRPEWARLNVQSLLHDADGRTWFGTDQGLFWQSDERSLPIERLRGVAVRGLLRAHDGALWVATEGKGLQRFAAGDAQGMPLQLGRAQGMPSNSPHVIVEDSNHHLWVNSNQGIYRITRDDVESLLRGTARTLSPLTLGLADGLLDLEGNGGLQPSAAMDTDGQIWFPTQRGVVRFSPAHLGSAQLPGRVLIEAVSAGRRAIDLHQANQSTLQLPLGVRDFSVRYNAAELNTGLVRFRYRLLGGGRNEEWVDAQSLGSASFDALAPGAYRFEVQAGNADGAWNPEPAILNLTVPAHLFETRLFRWGSLAIALAIGGLVIRWRLKELGQRAQRLEHMVQSRTDELVRAKANVEQALEELAQSHAALSESHLGIESRNQRLAEQATRLESLDRFRTRLLADVSHELRSPLMLVNLPLQELSERKLPEAERRLVSLASQQTGRLSHLVEQLVSLVQAEAQQIQLQLRRLDLRALIVRVVSGFAPVSLQSGVHFVVGGDTEDGLPWVYADPAHITTVVSNFLDNASKYAPANSEVQVRVRYLSASESLRVEVQDSGPGFPDELASRLFERFFRAEGPPRAGREGLGVGLALAQELIVLHGGRIGAINVRGHTDGAGSGACFWFELPLGSAHVGIEDLVLDASSDNPYPSLEFASREQPSAHLLLVEDHPELAAYLAERLAEHCPVVVVPDAETAWVRLHELRTGLVVSDVVLPGRSGIELCQQIKADAQLANTPLLLISAKAGKADRQRGLDAGAFDWLTKPFGLDALLNCVQRAWPEFSRAGRNADVAALIQPPVAVAGHREQAQATLQDRLLELAFSHLQSSAFGVSEWSERAHLSERQLRRRVIELTGMSPVAWLREQRLLRVRELITNGACRTLAEAGAMAGIDNAGYLYRLYRARFEG